MQSPTDVGLPFEKWRPGQQEMVSAAISNHSLLIIEAPTGLGKSANPGASAYFQPTIVMVATRELQQQYASSFHFLPIVWGQEHYACILPSFVSYWREAYGETPTRLDCPYERPSDCTLADDCPYEKAKHFAMEKQRLVTNYAYAFWTEWWRSISEIPPHLYLDEAHMIPDTICGLLTFSIQLSTIRKYKLDDPPFLAGSNPDVVHDAARWCEEAASQLERCLESCSEREQKTVKRRVQSLSFLAEHLSEAGEDEWYILSGISHDGFQAKPCVLLPEITRRIMPPDWPTVLMSATIGNPQALLAELGFPDVPFEFRTFPHPFARESRPVIFIKNSPPLSKHSTPRDYEAQAWLIQRILQNHPGQRGIIHTASWFHAEDLAKRLSVHFPNRIFLPRGVDRVEAVAEFVNRGPDTVAISPSWSHGLDLHDDLARFSIIAKVPFPNLGDPIVATKLKRLGRAWYDWRAAISIVQAAGRIVRHEQDWGITYIVDGHWPRVKRFAPPWFEVNEI